MNIHRWIDPRVGSVRVSQMCSYLLGRCWHLKAGPASDLLVFEGPPDDDGEPIIQVLPASERYSDYRQRLIELITSLSVIEDRSPLEVLNDILRQPPARGIAAPG